MTSNIDATKPASPNAYTADMRANFQAAADEISALQAAMDAPAPWLPLDGGTMVGPLTLADDPVNPLDAATMQYVDALVAAIPPVDLSGYLPLGGGVLTGDLTLGGTASRRSLIVDSGTGQSRIFLRSTAGSGQGNNSITFWDVTNNRGVGVYGGDYSGIPTVFMGMMSFNGGATGVAALRVTANDVTVSGSFSVTNGYPIFGGVPVLGSHLTNKDYVDAGDAANLPLTGGTLLGGFTVSPPDVAVAGTSISISGGNTSSQLLAGGAITLRSGDGASSGPINLTVGNAAAANGGGITLTAGLGYSNGAGGDIRLTPGAGGSGGTGGVVNIVGGVGIGGGNISLTAGSTTTTGTGAAGSVFVTGGNHRNAVTGGAGGNAVLRGGSGANNASLNGKAIVAGGNNGTAPGGDVQIYGGSSTAANGAGGNVIIYGGTNTTGPGPSGNVMITGLPAADPASVGALWVDAAAGFALKVSQG